VQVTPETVMDTDVEVNVRSVVDALNEYDELDSTDVIL